MQLWKILNLPAVDDQTISKEMIFTHDVLNRGIQVREKRCVC